MLRCLFLIVICFMVSVDAYSESCPPEKPIPSILGCKSCDEPEIIYYFKCLNCGDPDVDVLKVCPNRKRVWFGSGSGTVLKECPPEKPEKNPDGSCYHCSEEKEIFVKNKDYVNPCENRTIVQTSHDMYYSLINCPSDRPLRQYGKCYACNTPQSLTLDVDVDPSVCPNRRTEYVEKYGKYVSELSSDLESQNNVKAIADIQIEQSKTKPDDENGEYIIGVPYNRSNIKKNKITSVPKYQRTYYSCDTVETFIPLNKDDCTKICPNRYDVNGVCSICPKGEFYVEKMTTEFYNLKTKVKVNGCVSCQDKRYVYAWYDEPVYYLCPDRISISTWGGVYNAHNSIGNKLRSIFGLFY